MKPKLKEWTAVGLLACGMIMAFVALLIPPPGEIHDSVLYLFAQILIYCGTILSVTSSVASRQSIQELKEHLLSDAWRKRKDDRGKTKL